MNLWHCLACARDVALCPACQPDNMLMIQPGDDLCIAVCEIKIFSDFL